jgi:hypothetical protein
VTILASKTESIGPGWEMRGWDWSYKLTNMEHSFKDMGCHVSSYEMDVDLEENIKNI